MSGLAGPYCAFCRQIIGRWVFTALGKVACEDCHGRLYETGYENE